MIDPATIPATITALSALVAAVGVILGAYWAFRSRQAAIRAADKAESNEAQLAVIEGVVREIGPALDGRLTQLLKSETGLAEAKGIAEGEQRQRDRQAPPETSSDGGRRNGDTGGKP